MKKNITVGEIVANDYRAAAIFKEAGIDFCCGGKKNLYDFCQEKGIDMKALTGKLDNLQRTSNTTTLNFIEWEPAFLCDYIVNIHHKYVLKALPELVHYTGKIASVHGISHPELAEVEEIFSKINRELLQHLKNEEEVLFSAIKEFGDYGLAKSRETIISEINRLSGEHEFAGGAMDKINAITSGYRIPEDACNTYNVTYKLLQQFEDDLHVHVHLENNILFPKFLNSML